MSRTLKVDPSLQRFWQMSPRTSDGIGELLLTRGRKPGGDVMLMVRWCEMRQDVSNPLRVALRSTGFTRGLGGEREEGSDQQAGEGERRGDTKSTGLGGAQRSWTDQLFIATSSI